MDYVNLSNIDNISSIGSIGTESFSISSTTNTTNNNKQNGGGILDFLFSDNCGNIALLACKKGEFSTLSFLVREDQISDYTYQDSKTGYTVLHYVVSYYKLIPRNVEVLDKILSSDYVSSFVNIQDKERGNTPLHLAILTRNFEVADKLLKAGAEKNVKNFDDEYVGTENPIESPLPPINREKEQAIPDKLNKENAKIINIDEEDIFAKTDEYQKEESTDFANAIAAFMGIGQKDSASPSLRLSNIDSSKQITTLSEKDKQFVDSLDRKYDKNDNNSTDFPIEEIIRNLQSGGKKIHSNINQRKMKTYSELSESSAVDNQKQNLARMIENQASEIHERTITKIMQLLSIDREKAKAYKAALYAKIKKEHPELNNFDRAVEMEKLATINELEKINIDDWIDVLKRHAEEKSVTTPKTKEDKKDKKEDKKEDKKDKKEDKKDKKEKKEKKDKKSTSKRGGFVDTMDIDEDEISSLDSDVFNTSDFVN